MLRAVALYVAREQHLVCGEVPRPRSDGARCPRPLVGNRREGERGTGARRCAGAVGGCQARAPIHEDVALRRVSKKDGRGRGGCGPPGGDTRGGRRTFLPRPPAQGLRGADEGLLGECWCGGCAIAEEAQGHEGGRRLRESLSAAGSLLRGLRGHDRVLGRPHAPVPRPPRCGRRARRAHGRLGPAGRPPQGVPGGSPWRAALGGRGRDPVGRAASRVQGPRRPAPRGPVLLLEGVPPCSGDGVLGLPVRAVRRNPAPVRVESR